MPVFKLVEGRVARTNDVPLPTHFFMLDPCSWTEVSKENSLLFSIVLEGPHIYFFSFLACGSCVLSQGMVKYRFRNSILDKVFFFLNNDQDPRYLSNKKQTFLSRTVWKLLIQCSVLYLLVLLVVLTSDFTNSLWQGQMLRKWKERLKILSL